MWFFFQRLMALVALILLSPILGICILSVFLYDRKNPLYTPKRVGKRGKLFNMIKIRTMIVNAEANKVIATASTDRRITPVGKFLRLFKLDEFTQLINIVKGDMSFIGPRPQLISEYESFTEAEKFIVSITPGISDFSSLFLSDMEKFLAHYKDPYEAYFTLCRPIKSRLALFYIKHRSVWIDIQLIFLNLTNFINRKWTLHYMANMIVKLGNCEIPYEVLIKKVIPSPMELP